MNKTIQINENYKLLDIELGSISGLTKIKKSQKDFEKKGYDSTFIIQSLKQVGKDSILQLKLYGMQTITN
jgi:hypothetical protein